MASMASFLQTYGRAKDSAKVGKALGELLNLSDADAMLMLLSQPPAAPASELPQMSPIQPGELLREQAVAEAQAREQGAQRTLANIPNSPLAAGVALVSTPAYNRLTAEVPGANPEAPNVIAAVDNLSLGGLIEAPIAQSLLRAGETPSVRGPGARRRTPAPGPLERVEQTVAGETPILGRTSIEAPGGDVPAGVRAGARPRRPAGEATAALEPGTGNLLPEGGVTVGALLEAVPPEKTTRRGPAPPEELRLNRYLAVYGDPAAKVRNRGGKPMEYSEAPSQEAVRLEREGKPYFVGRLTPEQWLEKQQAWVGPKDSPEWNEARDWYKNLLSEFTDVYGPEAAPEMLTLWGLSQQRASPSAGMGHVLLAKDIAGGWREGMDKKAGLAHDRLMEALRGGDPGVGEKLADFADAIHGKTTRRWVGDDPRGGQPAPFDVHASRDVGFIDETTLSVLKKRFGPEVAEQFKQDMAGAPTDAQYAYGSKYYNTLKDVLNANLQPGERPYTAAEVQAIGWVGHQKMVGEAPEGPGAIFGSEARGRSAANISTVAVEAAPGEGAPLRAVWDQIPEPRRAEATYRVINETADEVARLTGVALRRRDPTIGTWEQYQNPNTTIEVVGTPEGAERFAKAMAYVHQQSEVWAQRSSIRDRANAFAMDVKAPAGFDLAKPEDVARFWRESGLAAVPGLGATKVRVQDGHRIRVIFERDLPSLSDAARQDGRDFDILAARARQALEASALEGWEIERRPLDLRKAVHDWKGDPSGQGHRQGLDRIPGGELDRVARRASESLRAFVGEGRAEGAEAAGRISGQAPQEVGVPLGALLGRTP